MNRLFRSISILAVLLAVATPARAQEAASDWRDQVDLAPLGGMAVHVQGRIKSFGSHANAMMDAVSGPRSIAGQSPTFTYLDMLFRPEAYSDADCIYIKNKLVRAQIADAIEKTDPALAERLEVFRPTGLVSPDLLDRPEVEPLLSSMERDLIRTAKQVDAIRSARAVMAPAFLLDRLRVIPPAVGDENGPWHGLAEIMFLPLDPETVDLALEGLPEQSPIVGLDEAKQRIAAAAWRDLEAQAGCTG